MSSVSRKPSRDVCTNGNPDELLARREGGAMDDEVEPAELAVDAAKTCVDLRVVGDVARQDQRIGQARRESSRTFSSSRSP